MKIRILLVAILAMLFAPAGSTEGHKKFVITLPLKALKCDWSKEYPMDMVCEVDVPSSATRIGGLLALRATVWTEEEWNGMQHISKQAGQP